jgi:hypothetical protein
MVLTSIACEATTIKPHHQAGWDRAGVLRWNVDPDCMRSPGKRLAIRQLVRRHCALRRSSEPVGNLARQGVGIVAGLRKCWVVDVEHRCGVISLGDLECVVRGLVHRPVSGSPAWPSGPLLQPPALGQLASPSADYCCYCWCWCSYSTCTCGHGCCHPLG